MRWASLTTVLLIGVLMWWSPKLSRPTVILGVAVPSTHIHDAVVVNAVRRYQRAIVVGTVLAALTCLPPVPEVVAVAVAPLLLVVLALGAYSWCRRSIMAAKGEQGWYDDVAVRVSASLSPEAAHPTKRYIWPHAAAMVIVIATAIYGALKYGDMPARIPTHYSGAGRPDTWSDKSISAVFLPVMIAGALVVVLAFCSAALRGTKSPYPDGDAAAARRRAEANSSTTRLVLGISSLIVAAAICGLSVMTWNDIQGAAFTAVLVGVVVMPIAAVVWAVFRQRRALQSDDDALAGRAHASSSSAVAGGDNAQSPDDDRYWLGGIIYSNPNDPNVFVPKRMGVGVTVNAASTGGKIFFGVIGLILVGSIAVALIFS